jgi:hypothetical protein
MSGKTPSSTVPCPQLQVQETGIRGYLMMTVQKPGHVINSSLPYIRATSSRIPENFLLKAQIVLLPNDGVLPTASIFTESSEEIFPAEWHFVTKLGQQVSPFPVLIFGDNKVMVAPFSSFFTLELRLS